MCQNTLPLTEIQLAKRPQSRSIRYNCLYDYFNEKKTSIRVNCSTFHRNKQCLSRFSFGGFVAGTRLLLFSLLWFDVRGKFFNFIFISRLSEFVSKLIWFHINTGWCVCGVLTQSEMQFRWCSYLIAVEMAPSKNHIAE